MITLAQKEDSKIAEEFKKIPANNPMCDELHKVKGDSFNEKNGKLCVQKLVFLS